MLKTVRILILLCTCSVNLYGQAVPVMAPGNGTLYQNGASILVHPDEKFIALNDLNKVRIYTADNFILYNVIWTGCRISHSVFSSGGKYLFVKTAYDGVMDECNKTQVFEVSSGDRIFETSSGIIFSQGNESEIVLVDAKKNISCYNLVSKKTSAKTDRISSEQMALIKQMMATPGVEEYLKNLYSQVSEFFLLAGQNGDYKVYLLPKGKKRFEEKGINTAKVNFEGKISGNRSVLVFESEGTQYVWNATKATLTKIPDREIGRVLNNGYLLYNGDHLYNSNTGTDVKYASRTEEKTSSDRFRISFRHNETDSLHFITNLRFDLPETPLQQRAHISNVRMYHDFPNVFLLNQFNWNIDDPTQYFKSGTDLAWTLLSDEKKLLPTIINADSVEQLEENFKAFQLFDAPLPPVHDHFSLEAQQELEPIHGYAGPQAICFYSDKNTDLRILQDSVPFSSMRITTSESKTIDSLLREGFTREGDSTWQKTTYEQRYAPGRYIYCLPFSSVDVLTKRNKTYLKNIQSLFNTNKIQLLNSTFPLYYFKHAAVARAVALSGNYTLDNKSINEALFAPGYKGTQSGKAGFDELRNALAITALTHPSKTVFGYNVYLLKQEEAPASPGEFGAVSEVYNQEINLPLLDGKVMGVNWGQGYFKLKDKSLSTLVTGIVGKDHGFMLITPDNYYYATKSFAGHITFRVKNTAYQYEQFDLKYNRPDIVLKRIGCKDSLAISSLHKAYLKRLKKMNFTESQLKDDFHLPEIHIMNRKDLPSATDSLGINLELEIKDSKFRLDRIQVYINNVPVYGAAGIDLRKENTQNGHKKIRLILTEGENKVQVSVLNQAGAESYKETMYITRKPKQVSKPNLYLVTIGDSKYKDNRFDLAYAAKDAKDIQAAFATNKVYGKVVSFSYTDEQVTRENILKLKTELQKATREDVLIITVAGHGVLDKDFNYYLATYDMDFNDPAKKGLAYEELETLLDGIAPLKKVLLLDACHSGEVDKEEVESMALATNGSDVKFRAAGAGIQKKNLGLKSASELMGELFTDLRRGTGATVVSSAGGAEYAMESDAWKNGLFTYCLLHGLKDKVADANNDGQIMLSELQNYLRTEVTKLSHGAQQPTSRIENLTLDFRIW